MYLLFTGVDVLSQAWMTVVCNPNGLLSCEMFSWRREGFSSTLNQRAAYLEELQVYCIIVGVVCWSVEALLS